MKKSFEHMELTAVEDYCFLSDPDAVETFIVEFTGRVRLYYENDTPVLPGLRQAADTPCLFTLSQGKRRWKKGFLPVLQICRNEEVLEELFASGKELCLKKEEKCFLYPSGVEIPLDEYEKRLAAVEKYWKNFFASLDEIPDLSTWAENGWKSSFVQSFSAFRGTHTKYGVEEYACIRHDGFPPTILAAAGALHEFGNADRARELLARYFERFLKVDGSLRYYGASLSEYGNLLKLACDLSSGAGGDDFFEVCLKDLLNIFRAMRDLLDCVMNPPVSRFALLAGSPEADLRERKGEYLHNNAAVLRGTLSLMQHLEKHNILPDLYEVQEFYGILKRRFDFAVSEMRKNYSFLPYNVTAPAEITDFTSDMDQAFANYRYYPELLESGVLEKEDALAIIKGRFERKGMICDLTALNYPCQYLLCFDHWPHTSFGKGLLEYGDVEKFHRILSAHTSLYMCQDLFTCYESELPGTPMKAYTDWCVPAQLVFPRLLKMCLGFTTWCGEVVVPGIPENLQKK